MPDTVTPRWPLALDEHIAAVCGDDIPAADVPSSRASELAPSRVAPDGGMNRGALIGERIPMTDPLRVAAIPCGSCPYRRDVPSGIWTRHEYDKLPRYDGPTWAQDLALFMCHQRDGNLCAGWLACHDPNELLALRFPRNIDPAVYDYRTEVPVFSSGAEARAHGMRDIKKPGRQARKMIEGLVRLRAANPTPTPSSEPVS